MTSFMELRALGRHNSSYLSRNSRCLSKQVMASHSCQWIRFRLLPREILIKITLERCNCNRQMNKSLQIFRLSLLLRKCHRLWTRLSKQDSAALTIWDKDCIKHHLLSSAKNQLGDTILCWERQTAEFRTRFKSKVTRQQIRTIRLRTLNQCRHRTISIQITLKMNHLEIFPVCQTQPEDRINHHWELMFWTRFRDWLQTNLVDQLPIVLLHNQSFLMTLGN